MPYAGREPELGQLDPGHGEQAGHQELVAQPQLEHVDLQRWLQPTPQAQLARREP